MVGEHMGRGLRIVWILILGGGRRFMGRMRMKKRMATMTMMMGVRGAVVSVLLRCVDDSSRGPITTSKTTTMRMRKMKTRKMMAHHRRRLDSNLQLHFVALSSFFFPPPTYSSSFFHLS